MCRVEKKIDRIEAKIDQGFGETAAMFGRGFGETAARLSDVEDLLVKRQRFGDLPPDRMVSADDVARLDMSSPAYTTKMAPGFYVVVQGFPRFHREFLRDPVGVVAPKLREWFNAAVREEDLFCVSLPWINMKC